jgi:hypothetical protein
MLNNKMLHHMIRLAPDFGDVRWKKMSSHRPFSFERRDSKLFVEFPLKGGGDDDGVFFSLTRKKDQKMDRTSE